MSSIDQQFIEFIVKSLVSNPDGVSINRRIDEKGVLLELTVAQEDLGRVIGKRGATAQSLRTLLRALGTKNDARYNLKIVDPEQDDQPRPAKKPQVANDDDNDNNDNNDNGSTTNSDDSNDSEETSPQEESDLAAKTRKELADLDDLDV